MKRSILLVIGAVVVLGVFATCGACAVGFKNSTQAQLKELNENMNGSREDLQGLTAQIAILNSYMAELVELKVAATNPETQEKLKEIADTVKRIADALEALNNKAGNFVGDDAEFPFFLNK